MNIIESQKVHLSIKLYLSLENWKFKEIQLQWQKDQRLLKIPTFLELLFMQLEKKKK